MALVIFFASQVVYWLQALAWPFAPGRDGYSYLYFAKDWTSPNPEDRFTIFFRTPIAGWFSNLTVDILGPTFAEVFLSLCFSCSVLLSYKAATFWGRRTALFFACILLFHSAWGSLFHVFSNEPPLAILFPVALFILLRSAQSFWASFFSGLIAGLLLLTRPGIFFLFFLTQFFRPTWKLRFVSVALFFFGLLPLYFSWVYRNHTQFGLASFAPGAEVTFPLARLLAADKTVKTSNGPASEQLGEAIKKTWPGQDPDILLRTRLGYFDLIEMADKVWGVGEYAVLKKAGFEALKTAPLAYMQGAGKNFLFTLLGNLKHPLPMKNGARLSLHKDHFSYSMNGRDQWEPMATYQPDRNYRDPVQDERMRQVGPKLFDAWNKANQLPVRDPILFAGYFVQGVAYVFPPILLWLLVGLIGWLIFRPETRQDWILLVLAFTCLATNVLASMSIWSVVYEYRLPMDPIYILFGLIPMIRLFRKIQEKWVQWRL